MKHLFEETVMNGMVLKNRLIRSATWEGMCEDDGRPTKKLADFYRTLARGGVGLIITGYTFIRPEGKQLPGKMGLHTDAFAAEMKQLVEAVHGEGGKICVQLVHAGGQTDSQNAGRQPVAPSAVATAQFGEVPESLSVKEIGVIVEAFGDAAFRAKEYGFDGVQIHGAHGYLINQFLSPLTNQRQDGYGGSIDNRCRFLMEVYHSVRKAVGTDYPVLIKLNGADNLPGGFTLEESVVAARMLDQAGIDNIEVSGGTPASGEESAARTNINKPEKEAYNLDLAIRIGQAVNCSVTSVGGYRSLGVVEKIIANPDIDYVSMARPLIREPDLPRRWQQGDIQPAACVSCNKCFLPGIKEGGIYCVMAKKEQERKGE